MEVAEAAGTELRLPTSEAAALLVELSPTAVALHPAEWIALLDVAGDVDLLPESLARAVGAHGHALGVLAEAVELEPQLEDVAPAREL